MATPTATQEQVAESYNRISALDLIRRDIWDFLVPVRPGEYGSELLNFFDYNGFSKPSGNVIVEHFEDRETFQTIPVTGGTQAVAGASLTLTISAPDGYGPNGYSGIRNQMTIILPNDVVVFVSNVNTTVPNAHTFDITPVRSTETIGTINNGDELVFLGNTFAEGTGGLDSLSPSANNFQFTHQIIKESYKTSGTAMTQKLWFQVDGGEFGSGWLWMYKGEMDTIWRFRQWEELTCLLGKDLTNTAAITTGERTMTGIIPTVRENNGIVQPGGTINLPFFDNLNNTIDRAFGAREYHWWMGLKIYQRMENFFLTEFNNGAIKVADLSEEAFRSFNLGVKDTMYDEEGNGITGHRVAMRMGFKSFEKSGFVHHFKKYRLFNHPNLLGAPGYRYPEFALGVPMDLVNNPMEDKKIPPACIRYLSQEGYSREMESFTIGSANMEVVATTDVDTKEYHYRSEKTVQLAGAHRWVIID